MSKPPGSKPDPKAAEPQRDDNLDDKGRDINTRETHDKHHPQAETEQGGKRDGR